MEHDYPMVHPTLQDRDFELLRDGDPIFMNLDGGCKLFARSDYEDFRDLPRVNSPSRNQQLNENQVETMAVAQVEGSEQTMERDLFPFFINEVTPLSPIIYSTCNCDHEASLVGVMHLHLPKLPQ